MPIGLDAVLNDKNFQDGLHRYTSGLSKMESATDHTANVLTRIGSVMQGAVVAGLGAMTVAVGGFVAASKVGLDTTLQWAEGLDKLGDQFGLSGEKASGFQFLANKVGLSVDEMGLGLNTLTRELNGMASDLKAGKQPTSEFAKGLQQLGVKATDSKGKIKSFDAILPEIMDAFEKLPSGINSSAVAMQLFGARGGSKFLDFLRQGSKGLTEAQKKAKLLGLQLSTEEVNAAEEFGFAVNELNLGIKGFWNQIGKQVLPVAKQLVDFINAKIIPVFAKWASDNIPKVVRQLQQLGNWIDRHIIPVLEPLSFVLQDVVALFTDFNRPIGDAGNALQAFAADVASLANMFGVDGVKIESMILGIADAISKISEGFKSGGAAGGLQAIGDALAAAVKNVDWTKVQAQLNTWKDQFWNWLTGKGGAIEQVSTQVGKVVTAIAEWAKSNAPDWLKILETWKTDFWNWLTNKDSGVLVTVADNMQKLSDMILEWANDSKTQKQFEEIGKQVANDVIDGMGRIFENPDEGDALISRLWRMMVRTAQNWSDSFARIGGSIAQGVFTGIISRFTDDETAQRIAGGIGQAFNNAISIMTSPGGWVQNLVSRFVTSFVNQLQATLNEYLPQLRISVPNPFGSTPAPQPTPLGTAGGAAGSAGASLGRSFASGGWVPFDMQAMIHAGEYVLNRQQARAFAPILAGANNSRTYNFNNTWNGNASAIDRGELARIAEDSAYRGIQRAMRGT